MEGLLQGRRALVTGAGSGIGEGIALAMSRAGAFVICADINGEAAMRTAAKIGADASAFPLDVTDRAAADALAQRIQAELGPIDTLVNNAGIIRRGKVDDPATRADWDATLAVNLDGVYNMVTAFLAQLKATRGCIINIGSIQSFVALPNSAAYTASKAAVRGLTQHLATELSPQGVRVNAIGPGVIATPINERARQNPEYMAHITPRIPMGRLGTPDDIAGPAVFLASDLARYVTGITMPVDGGFLSY
jgi:NAD(P)-dependent dehydrogenase (short-subunit alcohol dehydrogenase family)